MYYNISLENPDEFLNGGELPMRQVNFLFSDEYFPVTRRQMIKGWQFLKHKEKGGKLGGVDIMATIIQTAKDGMFIQPLFLLGLRNRQDTLIIFADYRGSMTSFHELTNRLIYTARNEGGHPRASVYYFQNYPTGYVYQFPNLTEPLKLKEALSKCNRNFTLAIVISDAGAARDGNDPERKKGRVAMTIEFLGQLNNACAHTIWLNPMPTHRWKGTAAEVISKNVFLMAPILDRDTYNFQDTLRTILKQNLKSIKLKK